VFYDYTPTVTKKVVGVFVRFRAPLLLKERVKMKNLSGSIKAMYCLL
jgi:hypothetical protein